MRQLFSGKRFFIYLPIVFVLLIASDLGSLRNNPDNSAIVNSGIKSAARFSLLQLASPTFDTGLFSGRAVATNVPTSPTSTREYRKIRVTPNYVPDESQKSVPLASHQAANVPSLAEFVDQVASGDTNIPRGLYVDGLMALPIVQQPDGDSAYIDLGDQTATQFQLASPYGNVGLLAHNYLAGKLFFDLNKGQELVLVYGDGHTQSFRVSEIDDYQRLDPTDLNSDFVELATQQKVSAAQVFTRFYEIPGDLTLQTCIAHDGQSSWGVRFIVASP